MFNGTPSGLRVFLSQLQNKFTVNHDHFRSEADKVSFAYSCLEPSTADCFCSHFCCLENLSIPPEILTVESFAKKLRYYFQDPALKEKADLELNQLLQKNTPFHDFITRFEDLITDSS